MFVNIYIFQKFSDLFVFFKKTRFTNNYNIQINK